MGPILRGTRWAPSSASCPGTGPAIASLSSYMLERRLAADPTRFGNGAIEGVAGPEAANNADAQCKFIPMLTLGLPASGVMALMLGALTIQGIQPGPQVMTAKPDLFWGLIASHVDWQPHARPAQPAARSASGCSILRVPYRLLFPAIMAFSAIGIYSVNATHDRDLSRRLSSASLGFVWMKLGFSPTPMLLGFVLGPMMEENLRRAMLMARGDVSVFLTRPISLAFLVVTALILIATTAPTLRRRRADIAET